MMSPITRLPFAVVAILFLSTTSARHLHHKYKPLQHRHLRHHARQTVSVISADVPTPVAIVDAELPSITAGDAVAEDVEQIQNGLDGLSSLPTHLVDLIEAIEQWLQAFKSMFTGSSSPEEPELDDPKQEPSVSSQESLSLLPTEATATAALPQSSLCRPAAGAGPLVPCPESQSFTTIRSTSTRSNTITTFETVSVTRPLVPIETTPSPAPYPIANSSSDVPVSIATLSYYPYTSQALDTGVTYTATVASATASPSPSPYTFNATSQDNVAVYYGTTSRTTARGLLSLCENSNVDIVILSFIYDYFSANDYPTFDFGPGCTTSNIAQQTTAPGLKDCSVLATEVASCQAIGKKVLISLGGYIANSSFLSTEQATDFATTLWGLFGAGTPDDPSIRPFGSSVIVDGFDIDNEDHSTAYYPAFASALRTLYATDSSKTYYLSAAPQCPRPDQSIPLEAMALADFVWVQFYNNPSCNLDTEDFQASFAAWSADLAAIGLARVYVGIAGFEGAGQGYVSGNALYSRIVQARELDVPNLGGIMMWDGTEAFANEDALGVDYLEYAKEALHV